MGGPTQLEPNQSGSWNAFVTGAGTNVNYTWSVDGETAQDGPSGGFQYTAAGSGGFIVSVTVRDSYGTVGTANQEVYVGSGSPCGAALVC